MVKDKKLNIEIHHEKVWKNLNNYAKDILINKSLPFVEASIISENIPSPYSLVPIT